MKDSNDKSAEVPVILIADDTSINRQLLGALLIDEGYELIMAKNGLEVLDYVKNNIPDMILLDIMMPEMDGFETLSILKMNSETEQIPVIFLSAMNESEDIVKGFELGAVDYLTKPFIGSELIQRIRTQMELKTKQDALELMNNRNVELIHTLTHDLTNPLAQIKTILQLSEQSPAIFDEFKNDLIISVDNGLEIIDSVRNLKAMETEKLILEPVNLNEAFKESESILNQKFTSKNVKIKLNIKGTLYVMAQKTILINSIINNLLTNALKFSYRDSFIYIDAFIKEKGIITLSIRDTGIGIPDYIMKDIFLISKKTSRPGTDGESGTGFGMPLVKKFIDLFGGEITVQSVVEGENGNGTIVTINLEQVIP